jgi:hypothetical protein
VGIGTDRRFGSAAVVRRIGAVPLACLLGGLVLVAGSAIVWNTSPYWGRNANQAPITRSVGVVPKHVTAARTPLLVEPDRIAIPRLHAVAPVVKVATTASDELDIPLNPKIVGWWSPGAKPGARHGTAILAGHINYSGVTGALADIGRLRAGDRVLIYGHRHGKRRELRLQVTGVRIYHKTHLPYQRIFAQDGPGRVALVTCGGPFDAATGNYLDNVVAFAVPAAAHTRALTP